MKALLDSLTLSTEVAHYSPMDDLDNVLHNAAILDTKLLVLPFTPHFIRMDWGTVLFKTPVLVFDKGLALLLAFGFGLRSGSGSLELQPATIKRVSIEMIRLLNISNLVCSPSFVV